MKALVFVTLVSYACIAGVLIHAKTNLSPENHCIVTCGATEPLAYTNLATASSEHTGFRAFRDLSVWTHGTFTFGIFSAVLGVIFNATFYLVMSEKAS